MTKTTTSKLGFLAAVFLFPLILSSVAFLGLSHQPSKLWRRLMPAQIFSHPQRDLKLLVLSKTDQRNWETLLQSTYFYKDGSWRWLVLKEELQSGIRPGPSTIGIAIAVDNEGKFFEIVKGSGDEALSFRALDDLPANYKSHLMNGFLLAEDQETFFKMQKRIPGLRIRKLGGTFSEALARTETDYTQKLGTFLKPGFIFRFAAILGFAFSLMVAAWMGSLSLYPGYRIALCALALPTAALTYLWVFQWGTLISTVFFPIWPWLLWALGWGAVAFYTFWSTAPLSTVTDTANLKVLGKELRKNLVPIGIPAIVIGAYLATLSFTMYLTWGDGSAYTWAGAAIYDLGEWSIPKLHALNLTSLKNFITYPPGISVFFGYFLWAAGPSKTQIFFPGQETGTVCLLYGGLLVLTHLCLIISVLGYLRAKYQASKTFGIFAVFFVLYAVPSSCGIFHGSEAFLWPTFACAVVSLALFRETASPLALLGTVVLVLGLPYLKKESAVQITFLLLPWGAFCIRSLYRTSARLFLVAGALAISFLLPLVIVQWQRNALGISTPDFTGFSLVEIFHRISNYPPLFRQALDIFLARGDVYYVTHPIPFLVLALVVFVAKQMKRFEIKDWLVPVFHLAFLCLFPMMYLFSSWSTVWLHLFQSWGRIVLPVYFSLGWWTAELYLSLIAPKAFSTSSSQFETEISRPELSLNLSENP